MTHITIEYMIMVPLLILQVLFFPLVTSWMMNMWVDSRRKLVLQHVASTLGSSIQQLYLSLNHEQISSGNLIYYPNVPKFIENHPYTAVCYMNSTSNSSRILEIRVTLNVLGEASKALVTLGPNVQWQNSVFVSNSTSAHIKAVKYVNGTIVFSFGG